MQAHLKPAAMQQAGQVSRFDWKIAYDQVLAFRPPSDF